MRDIGLYIHVPYCASKCPYCDFNSYAVPQFPEARYVDAVCAEAARAAREQPWTDAQIASVFFGGGTPSLFSAASIARMLHTVAGLWAVESKAETTLEANPGTVSLAQLHELHAAGVNRISFGVQSFHARHLQRLGRIHDGADSHEAVAHARAAGFDNVSIDLIFALPEQTPAEWLGDLREACALQVDHVSAYGLTYEDGTPFARWRSEGSLRPQPEETEIEMFLLAREHLAAAGYAAYEVSNFARPGHECRHNLHYWRSGPYLGLGAGAHSYSGPTQNPSAYDRWGRRWSNVTRPEEYMSSATATGQARATLELLDEQQARGEFVFLALRRAAGVSAPEFRARFGCALEACFPHLASLVAQGLLEPVDERWRLTERGLLLADSVFATFL
jgi:oxygen-independent coproporphyrinogen-3 oxidase